MGAVGPTVKLTFAGDSTQLDKTMDNIGGSTEKMSSKVDDSSKKAGSSITSIKDKAGEAADGTEKKMLGLHDTVDGVSGVFQGFADGSVTEMAQGLADLAGGMADFVIPTIATMGGTLTGTVIPAIWGFTSALLANPITWIVVGIIALIAAIVLLVTHFQQVKAVVADVVGWIKDAWNSAATWFEGVGDKIKAVFSVVGAFFSSLWSGIGNGLKSAINWIIDRINGFTGGLSMAWDWIPGTKPIPKIPHLHTGGVVPGVAGSEMLTVLQAGERVIPATGPQGGKGGGNGGTITFAGNTDSAFATAFMNLVRSGAIQVSS